ncbi:MAG: RdgB/HAM1 family non-canonical purine NTP pyrophosphatase [Aquificaceae bacterium]|jgi:XTP/dITP diphosphohydrolase|uniref:RdgB/HAM1 family non-canonical purine NTP pyrophosphatase n=1 Tax=Hydrogenobacter sp. Uz 6-8 TaxID=3384828 RepID=UPI00309CE2A1
MLRRLLIATTNQGKVREIKSLFEGSDIELLMPDTSLEVEERGCSFLENAYIKARAYYEVYRIPALAEDSGLVIPALEGYPGVYSSRFYQIDWGGKEPVKESKDRANIEKVLRLMKHMEDRRAYYTAFVVVYAEGGGLWAEGRCYGTILTEPRGAGGFGYDPIFQPEGFLKSMAELSMGEKNLISHRGKAARKLIQMLK